MNKSKLFTWYNKARKAPIVERGRLNRALGLLQRADGGQSQFDEYGTALNFCGCPDQQYTRHYCKHQLAKMLEHRVYQGAK